VTVNFRVLGPLEADAESRPLRLGGSKQRALLGILLLNANEVVSSDRLIDELWDRDAPESATKALQVHVSQLRKALEPGRAPGDPASVLLTQPPGYVLKVAPERLDRERFEHLAAEGRRLLGTGEPAGAVTVLKDALALWRGPALADLAYASFAQAEIGRLEELRLSALEDRIQAELECGRHTAVVAELERLVAAEPLRERPRGQLMLALSRSGRQADALEVYRKTREVLVEELGIEPGKSLQDLHAAILDQDPSLEAPAAPRPMRDTSQDATAPRTTEDFVGRTAELEDLEIALEGAVMGRGSVCLIRGEPGIGKSRLADELAERARQVDAQVLWGRCWEAGGAPAYWPWVHSLREHVRGVAPDALRDQLASGGGEVAHLIPELRDRLPDLPVLESPDSEGARFRLFDATTAFLKRAAAERPVLLVLEDLHAADTPSLLLLQFLAGEIADSRMLVVGTYRDIELAPSNPAAGALVAVERQQSARTLVLRGFAEADVCRLIEVIGGVAPSPKVSAAIHSATGGNPLFVGELVRLLLAEGRLEQPVDDVDVRMAIPRGVRDVIARRLAQVSEPAREILEVASVLGREFELDTLASVTGRSVDDLLELLDEAIGEGVIAESPGGAYRMRFSHVLIRDAIYDELGAGRRRQLHRRTGEALEELHEHDPDPNLAEIAHHFFEAGPSGDPQGAYEYARAAGDRAARLLAYEEAVRLYGLAIRVIDAAAGMEDPERGATLLALGNAQLRAGDEAAAKETFLAAAALARQLRQPQALAHAALGYGGRYVWMAARGDPHVIPLLEEALSALSTGDSALRAMLMARLSSAIRDQPFRERRLPLSEEAVEMARRASDNTALAYALDARCIAVIGPETREQFGETAAEVMRLGEVAGDRDRVLQGHLYRVFHALQLGDLPAARRDLETVTRLAEESREPGFRFYAADVNAALALFEGRFEQAPGLIRHGYEIGRRAASFTASASYLLQMLVLHREQGAPPYEDSKLREFADRQPTYTILRCALAALLVGDGRTAEATRLFEDLVADDFSRIYIDEEWLASVTFLTEVCWSLGDVERARFLYQQLLPFRNLNAVGYPETVLGSVERPLGILAGMIGRSEDSEDHFRCALDSNTRMGARPCVAHTQHDHARMLIRRGSPEERHRGLHLLAATREAYRDLGMTPWEARVEEELEASR
jgi:DNA-binding SARP family transcriptional activator/tetratricopeptide (TPR) repeat protein